MMKFEEWYESECGQVSDTEEGWYVYNNMRVAYEAAYHMAYEETVMQNRVEYDEDGELDEVVADGGVSEWQPIETAPKDEIHVRGMWVYSADTGRKMYWAADAGYEDEDGDFRLSCGDDSGWRAEDYTHWHPLPAPPAD